MEEKNHHSMYMSLSFMMFNESPTTPPKWPTQTSTLYQISSGSWTSTSISPKLILQEKKQELVVDLHEYLDLFRDRPTKPDVQQFSRMSDCVHNQLEAKKTPKPHIATSKSFTDLSRELQRKEHQRSDSILYTYIPLSINVYYDAWWRKTSQKPHIISYIYIYSYHIVFPILPITPNDRNLNNPHIS